MLKDMEVYKRRLERNTIHFLCFVLCLAFAWITHRFTTLKDIPIFLAIVGAVGAIHALINYRSILADLRRK